MSEFIWGYTGKNRDKEGYMLGAVSSASRNWKALAVDLIGVILGCYWGYIGIMEKQWKLLGFRT